MNDQPSPAFEQGYRNALERGPKNDAEIKQIRQLSESDYRDYLRGVKAGLDKINAAIKG